jgi:tRNA (pseudouridine54-N1)-methyltransferase
MRDPTLGHEDQIREVLNGSNRNFIVVAHRARTDDGFSLNDLCGDSGRMDGITRCINASLFLSHGMRRDSSIHIILLGPKDPPKVLSVSGMNVRYLNPDERSTAALIKRALAIPLPDHAGSLALSTPGISVIRGGLEFVLSNLEGRTYLLDEGGGPIDDILNEGSLHGDGSNHFILSDDMDLTGSEVALIKERVERVISVSPNVLHADHSITVTHNYLDRSQIFRRTVS